MRLQRSSMHARAYCCESGRHKREREGLELSLGRSVAGLEALDAEMDRPGSSKSAARLHGFHWELDQSSIVQSASPFCGRPGFGVHAGFTWIAVGSERSRRNGRVTSPKAAAKTPQYTRLRGIYAMQVVPDESSLWAARHRAAKLRKELARLRPTLGQPLPRWGALTAMWELFGVYGEIAFLQVRDACTWVVCAVSSGLRHRHQTHSSTSRTTRNQSANHTYHPHQRTPPPSRLPHPHLPSSSSPESSHPTIAMRCPTPATTGSCRTYPADLSMQTQNPKPGLSLPPAPARCTYRPKWAPGVRGPTAERTCHGSTSCQWPCCPASVCHGVALPAQRGSARVSRGDMTGEDYAPKGAVERISSTTLA